MSDVELEPGRGSDASDLAIGLLGRSLRDRDARGLGVIHIEDNRPTARVTAAEAVRAWAKLAELASRARHERSDWIRYGIPIHRMGLLTEEQAVSPPRSLDDISMPPEVRAKVESLESLSHKSCRQIEPVTVLSGLVLADISHADTDSIHRLFVPGQSVELRGFLSASALVDPPLYAAGMDGAMLEISIHFAAEMFAVMPRQREIEYFLPRDCRCRVLELVPSRSYRLQDGEYYVRTGVRLQQL
jgi:hypothetical protein